MGDWKAKYEDLNATYAEYKKQAEEYEGELSQELDESRKREEDALRKLEKARDELDSSRSSSSNGIIEIQDRLKVSERLCSQLTVEKRKLEQQKDALEDAKRRFEALIEDQKEKLEESLEQQVLDRGEAEEKLEEKEELIQRLRQELQDMKGEVGVLRKKVGVVGELPKSHSEYLNNEPVNEIEDLRAQIKHLREEVVDLEGMNEELRADVTGLTQDLLRSDNALRDLEEKLANLPVPETGRGPGPGPPIRPSGSSGSLVSLAASSRGSSPSGDASKLKRLLDEKENEIVMLVERKEELKQRLDDVMNENQNLREENEVISAEMSQMAADLINNTAKYENEVRAREEEQSIYESKVQEYGQLEARTRTVVTEKKQLQQQLSILERKLLDLETSRGQLQAEITQIREEKKDQLSSSSISSLQLETKMKHLEQQMSIYEKSEKEYLAQIEFERTKNNKLQQHIDQLGQTLGDNKNNKDNNSPVLGGNGGSNGVGNKNNSNSNNGNKSLPSSPALGPSAAKAGVGVGGAGVGAAAGVAAAAALAAAALGSSESLESLQQKHKILQDLLQVRMEENKTLRGELQGQETKMKNILHRVKDLETLLESSEHTSLRVTHELEVFEERKNEMMKEIKLLEGKLRESKEELVKTVTLVRQEQHLILAKQKYGLQKVLDSIDGMKHVIYDFKGEIQYHARGMGDLFQDLSSAMTRVGTKGGLSVDVIAKTNLAKQSEVVDYAQQYMNQANNKNGNIRVICKVRPLLPFEKKKTNKILVEFPSKDTVALVGVGKNGELVNDPSSSFPSSSSFSASGSSSGSSSAASSAVTSPIGGGAGGSGSSGVEQSFLPPHPSTPYSTFTFDRVFQPYTTQEETFEECKSLIYPVLAGFNCCIFAYGQTGSGKTFTMEGTTQHRGINFRSMDLIFQEITRRVNTFKYKVQVSLIEIYNENLNDLLATCSIPSIKFQRSKDQESKLKILQNKENRTYVQGATVATVTTADQVMEVLTEGNKNRQTDTTAMNEHSSRSHLLLLVDVYGTNLQTSDVTYGKLCLVDLAGSERVAKTESKGQRLVEASYINKSLSHLGEVILALHTRSTDKKQKDKHIPFRNSKLTYLLQDSLSGNSRTLMFVNISPADWHANETQQSLQFAGRVNKVRLGEAVASVENGVMARLRLQLDEMQRSHQQSEKKHRERFNRVEGNLREKDEEVENLRQQLKSFRDHASENETNYETRVRDVEKSHNELQRSSTRQLAKLEAILKEKEQVIEKLDRKVREDGDKRKELIQDSKQVAHYGYEMRKKDEQIKQLSKKVEEKASETEKYLKANKEIQLRVVTLEKQLSDHLIHRNSVMKTTNSETEQMKNKAKQTIQRNAQLEAKQESYLQEIRSLTKSLRKMEQTLAEARENQVKMLKLKDKSLEIANQKIKQLNNNVETIRAARSGRRLSIVVNSSGGGGGNRSTTHTPTNQHRSRYTPSQSPNQSPSSRSLRHRHHQRMYDEYGEEIMIDRVEGGDGENGRMLMDGGSRRGSQDEEMMADHDERSSMDSLKSNKSERESMESLLKDGGDGEDGVDGLLLMNGLGLGAVRGRGRSQGSESGGGGGGGGGSLSSRRTSHTNGNIPASASTSTTTSPITATTTTTTKPSTTAATMLNGRRSPALTNPTSRTSATTTATTATTATATRGRGSSGSSGVLPGSSGVGSGGRNSPSFPQDIKRPGSASSSAPLLPSSAAATSRRVQPPSTNKSSQQQQVKPPSSTTNKTSNGGSGSSNGRATPLSAGGPNGRATPVSVVNGSGPSASASASAATPSGKRSPSLPASAAARLRPVSSSNNIAKPTPSAISNRKSFSSSSSSASSASSSSLASRAASVASPPPPSIPSAPSASSSPSILPRPLIPPASAFSVAHSPSPSSLSSLSSALSPAPISSLLSTPQPEPKPSRHSLPAALPSGSSSAVKPQAKPKPGSMSAVKAAPPPSTIHTPSGSRIMKPIILKGGTSNRTLGKETMKTMVKSKPLSGLPGSERKSGGSLTFLQANGIGGVGGGGANAAGGGGKPNEHVYDHLSNMDNFLDDLDDEIQDIDGIFADAFGK